MPEPGVDVLVLLADRVPPALALGLAAGVLSWLLGLARVSGTLAIIVSTTVAFVTALWSGAVLAALTFAIAGVTGRVAYARSRPNAAFPPKLGARSVTGLTAVAWLCAAAALGSERPGYWAAAACGAMAAGLATWTGHITATTSAGQHIRLHSLRPLEHRLAGLNAVGLTAGLVAALAIAATAMSMHLIGPGDPALVAVAALFAMAAATAPKGASAGAAVLRRVIVASVVGGPLSALLVALIP